MNKQQLASKIWESANKMRSKIEANEYKDYILGFIFYKFLSDNEVKYLKEEQYYEDKDIKGLKEKNKEDVRQCQNGVGYFIAYDDLFSTWISKGKDFDVSDVRDAFSAFNRNISNTHKKLFDKIFDTLQTGLSKLGTTSGEQTKAIKDLLMLIKDIPMDNKQDYDVLGFIYEYLISNFAANAGKKAGEFYTPHEVSLLMSEIVANHLKDKKQIEIYDPTSGSGSLLINIGKSVAKYINDDDNIKYYAQELKENTYNLTRMNLIMRGIIPSNIEVRNGDTLEDDWPIFEEEDKINTYKRIRVNAVVSNPPYSQAWDPTNKEHDVRYKDYGLAPRKKADFAFLLHDLYHILPDGIMTIVLPHGVLFRGGDEKEIRKNLISQNNIDTIIGLPSNIFFGTGIPTIIMVLKQPQERENSDVLIIDASKGFEKEGKNNKLRACDIKKIVDTIKNRASIDKYSRVVGRQEIIDNDYNLNISRYVDSNEEPETYDIYASMFGGIPEEELDKYNIVFKELDTLKDDIVEKVNEKYYELKADNIKDTINNNDSVKKYIKKYNNKFSDLHDFLYDELITKIKKINIQKEVETISSDLFERLKSFNIIDNYNAYQVFYDNWIKIAVDLEIIETEGFDSVKQVDPNMVIKKKKGEDIEVQDGYKGHILPFDLVQKELLLDDLNEIKNIDDRINEIDGLIEEYIENLDEEDKESLLNENKDAFDNESLKKAYKEYGKDKKKYDENSVEYIVISTCELLEEQKEKKKILKTKEIEFHLKTKDVIENLNDKQVKELLDKKWISPIVESINKIPYDVISDFSMKLDKLSKKYENTYENINKDIDNIQKKLSKQLDELTGDEFDMKGIKELEKIISE